MSQSIIKGLTQINQIIEGKKVFLVKDSVYDYLKIKEFFHTIPHIEFRSLLLTLYMSRYVKVLNFLIEKNVT